MTYYECRGGPMDGKTCSVDRPALALATHPKAVNFPELTSSGAYLMHEYKVVEGELRYVGAKYGGQSGLSPLKFIGKREGNE